MTGCGDKCMCYIHRAALPLLGYLNWLISTWVKSPMEVLQAFDTLVQRRCARSRVKVTVRVWLSPCVVRIPSVGRTQGLYMPLCFFLPTFLIVPNFSLFLWGFSNSLLPQKLPLIPHSPFALSGLRTSQSSRGWGTLSYWEKYKHFLLKYMYVRICIF